VLYIGRAARLLSSGGCLGGRAGGQRGQDLVVVAFFCEQLLVVRVAEQLTATHRKRYHTQRTIALAALEAGLVDNLALHLELLHGVHSLAARDTLVAAAALEWHFRKINGEKA